MPVEKRRPGGVAAIIVVALVVLVAAFSPASAFDGKRSGFVLGVHGGYGTVWEPHDGQGSGVATELKIGGGIDERTILHYAGKQVWASDYWVLLPMVGVTRYLDDGPGAFFTGGGGLGGLASFAGSEGAADGGFSLFGGLGYEFARHWSVEVDYVHVFIPASIPDHNHDTGTLMVTIGGLAY